MKALIYMLLFSIWLILGCKKMELDVNAASCINSDNVNTSHSKAERIQQLLNEITKDGIPGVALAIHTNEGYWAGTSGYAKIETAEEMQICHLQYGQSVAKTYMATAILLLWDQGKLDLDEKIIKYLPEDVSAMITDAEQISVRMLLNHTSGIPEYNDKPDYVTYLLQHPQHSFSTMDYLAFVMDQPLLFTPGSKYQYTNTNYILLAMIADAITGDHAAFIQEKILQANGLINSCYHKATCFDDPILVNSYWDRYSNGQIENISKMQQINVASLIGDDGIVATPIDYVKFLKALFEGQILSQTAMNEMLIITAKEAGSTEGYGLGIHKEIYKGFTDHGHTGGGIGSGCILSYFPEKNVYIFLGINIGTSIYSPNFDKLEEKINAILDVVLD